MRDVLILSYHAVSPAWPAGLAVEPGRLERQLGWLLRRGYRPTTFHAAATAPPAPRSFAITFDDAYRSVLEHGFPVLERLGVPGTVFVPTDFPERGAPMAWPGIDGWLGGPHERELVPLSWDELRRLAGAGWEIGSHTRSHPHLTELDDAALADELRGSRERIERELGLPCRTLAYPYGDHDDRVVAATRAAGYEAAATVPVRLDRDEPLRRPRIGIYRVDDERAFRIKVSPTVRRARRLPVSAALGRAWTAARGRLPARRRPPA